MRWLKRLVVLIILAWAANIASCQIQGTYQGVVGNLCIDEETGTNIDCYDALPTGGFPITYAWDDGLVSVVGNLNFIEDRFDAKLMWLNFGVYLVLFAGIWKFGRWRKRLKLRD